MDRNEIILALKKHCSKQDLCTECVIWEETTCDPTEMSDEELLRQYNKIMGIPEIKDSGDRTQFSTGAVRDMHEGKGRLDLMPCTAILELAKHCENGALKYGERNVDKGIPQHSLIDSGLRHLFKYLRGDKDENHLVSALWNIAFAVEQDVNKPELNDLPWAKKE